LWFFKPEVFVGMFILIILADPTTYRGLLHISSSGIVSDCKVMEREIESGQAVKKYLRFSDLKPSHLQHQIFLQFLYSKYYVQWAKKYQPLIL
jgi:hypothetical protein